MESFCPRENFSDFKDGAERAYILQKLRENDWNVAETARRVDMPRGRICTRKSRRYGLVSRGLIRHRDGAYHAALTDWWVVASAPVSFR